MKKHSIFTLTGQDMIGKQTQTQLLGAVLQPSRPLTFPDYFHWSGEIIKAVLQEKTFQILGNNHSQHKHPQIFQMLQAINRIAHQEEIKEGLKHHHWVADRYDIDSLAYGLQDGCDLEFLLALGRLIIPSDLSIIMVGEPFPRPGELPDINERDTEFQNEVKGKYLSLARLFPHWRVINVDLYRCDTDATMSMLWVHREVCRLVSEYLDEEITPLDYHTIVEVLNGEHQLSY